MCVTITIRTVELHNGGWSVCDSRLESESQDVTHERRDTIDRVITNAADHEWKVR